MLRLLIADDYKIARNRLKEILLREFPSAYIEEAGDTDTLLSKAMNNHWDLVITDLNMPGISGLDAIKEIVEKKPALPVLVVSLHTEEQYVREALQLGAKGFIGKGAVHDELGEAVKKILGIP